MELIQHRSYAPKRARVRKKDVQCIKWQNTAENHNPLCKPKIAYIWNLYF